MPTGTIDYSPPTGVQTAQATAFVVCRYDGSGSPNGYTILPNVYCEQIQFKEGAEPPTAQFSYILNDSVPIYPSQFDQLWPINSPPNPYKVQAGDRLVVLYIDPWGNYRVAWDGFAQLPQTDIGPRSQAVTFVGVHVSIRLWDDVVTGRWQRDADTPTTSGSPVQTDLPTRFNPDDLPNCTPAFSDETDPAGSGDTWPVFLEPRLAPVAGVLRQTYWDLSKFTRYMLWYYNNQNYVANPDFVILDDLLSNRSPLPGQTTYDPTNPATYIENPIIIRDYDPTNKLALEAIEQQLGYAGFRLRFGCQGTPVAVGSIVVEVPWNYIEIYRFDAAGPTAPKQVSLQATGNVMDVTRNNVAAFSATNDFHGVANQWTVETKPVHYEIGVLLAPGFQPAAGDELPANRKQWLLSNQGSTTAGVREKYRLYIADECGDGHWNLATSTWVTSQPISFAGLFVDPILNPTGDYVTRYRPGLNRLFSLDPSGEPYEVQLRLSRDYAGPPPPCAWNGTGTWQTIGGGWRVLHDKLGIFVDIDNPMQWSIGSPDSNPAQEASGVLDGVTSLSAPVTPPVVPPYGRQQLFYLMLVTVIEGDLMIGATAPTRPASPYPYSVARQVDAKDYFRKKIVDTTSPFNLGVNPIVTEDDTQEAQTYANQMRAAHEFPPISASLTIPWFSPAYSVGDRIAWINGRNVSLQVNAGTGTGEKPSYPYVVGVNWDLRGKQQTILQLSDRRTEPAPYRYQR
jgi:hypothetical protein